MGRQQMVNRQQLMGNVWCTDRRLLLADGISSGAWRVCLALGCRGLPLRSSWIPHCMTFCGEAYWNMNDGHSEALKVAFRVDPAVSPYWTYWGPIPSHPQFRLPPCFASHRIHTKQSTN